MKENIFTIGLFDKNTERQETSSEEAENIISTILIENHNVFAFTMFKCSGVYRMKSTGRIVQEPSIRIEIVTDEELTAADAIIADLKTALNQESIMHKVSEAQIYFK